MNEKVVFLGHLGLGDHIIQQGIVNKLANNNKNVVIFCKHHNFLSVKHLCDGYNNIEISSVKDDNEVKTIVDRWLTRGEIKPSNIVPVGIYNSTWHHFNKKVGFDKYFYEQIALDFQESYNIEINEGPEPVQDFQIPNKPFTFVHDDPSRNFNIDIFKYVDHQKYIVVKPWQSKTIFDFLPLLKRAKEIHCMDSCFALMIDRAKGIDAKKYLHRYIRKNSFNPSYKNDWKIIK